MRSRRHHRRRPPASWREATSSRMLFFCNTRSTKSLITIITSYDRRVINVRLDTAHTNVKSSLNESILRLSNPFPIRLSVADCPCEWTFISFAGFGSLGVANDLPEICRGFKLLVKPGLNNKLSC
jgi:hypothetical protein